MENLTLNNGQTAIFKYVDSWHRPVYELENEFKACCINLDGTYLHSMSKDGEPNSPLLNEYQPRKEKP